MQIPSTHVSAAPVESWGPARLSPDARVATGHLCTPRRLSFMLQIAADRRRFLGAHEQIAAYRGRDENRPQICLCPCSSRLVVQHQPVDG